MSRVFIDTALRSLARDLDRRGWELQWADDYSRDAVIVWVVNRERQVARSFSVAPSEAHWAVDGERRVLDWIWREIERTIVDFERAQEWIPAAQPTGPTQRMVNRVENARALRAALTRGEHQPVPTTPKPTPAHEPVVPKPLDRRARKITLDDK
jgi:hypothetical protein